MNIIEKYLTENMCYKSHRIIVPKGIMVHSTATPGVMAGQWFNRWNNPNTFACVHAFVDDKDVYQCLPWNYRGWHAGGAANNTHISFEICEPAGFRYSGNSMIGYNVIEQAPYFEKAYNNAVALCIFLCRMYGLTEKDIIDHSEGYKRGIATNHGDVMHWFPKHGKSMDTLRADVKRALNNNQTSPTNPNEPVPVTTKEIDTIKEVQSYINSKISAGLAVDGSFGPKTKEALIKYWQKTVGGLAVDGSFGPLSKAKASDNNLSRGSKGELVRIMQLALIVRGFDLKPYGADGSFGPATEKELKEFQKSRGLKVDGICGSNSWTELFK